MDDNHGHTTLDGLIAQLGDKTKLDPVATFIDDAANTLLGDQKLRKDLQGEGTTGTPIHPALVHFPIGGAFSAALLDVMGLQAAAGVVTGLTVATALPTAAAGLADYTGVTDKPARRVAAAHWLCAMTGGALSAVSLVARVGGSKGLARASLLGSCAAFAAAGALGGNLVYGKQG